jgi:PAS domain S-box-containing protein
MSEDAPVMIWTSDARGRCVHLNRMLRDFWDVREGATETFDWSQTIHPHDVERVQTTMQAALAGRRSVTVTARYRRGDGTYRVLETTASPQFDGRSGFCGMVGVNIDITEREAAERALRESEQRFRDLAETVPQLVWTSDAMGVVDYWNSRIALFRRGAPSQEDAVDWREIVHPDDLTDTVAQWTQAVAAAVDHQHTHRLLMSDGTYRWHISRASPVCDAEGRILRWYGTATDIHDLSEAQDRLHGSEKRQRIAVEAAGLGVFEWHSAQDTAIWENDRMFEIVGRDRSDGPMSFRDFLDSCVVPEDADEVRRALIGPHSGDDAVHLSFRIRRLNDGAARWVELAGRFEQPSAGSGCLVGVLSDVTQERRAQEHRMLLVNELNHRVKNTLAVVQGMAKRTFKPEVDTGTQLRAFDGRLMALAQAHDLLTRESWRSALLSEVAEVALRERAGEEERILIDGPRVELSAKQAVTLAMALHELYTNAVKYGALSDDRGHVEFVWAVEGAEEPQLWMRWSEHGGPPVLPPTQRGFGSSMIQRALGAEFQANVELDFRTSGFVCQVLAPLPRLAVPARVAEDVIE